MRHFVISQTPDETWMLLLPYPQKTKKHFLAPACQPICEFPLHRPHLACIKCYFRRAHYNKIENPLAVQVYYLFIHKYKRFAVVKDKLLDLVLSVAEFLAG